MPDQNANYEPEVWRFTGPDGKEMGVEIFCERASATNGMSQPILIRVSVFNSRCHPLFAARAWGSEATLQNDKERVRDQIGRLIEDDLWENGKAYTLD